MTNNAPIDRSRAARSSARRQHLLDTARNLFIDKGFHQTGMAQIATASGIAVGQIYRDFANKEAIIAAISDAGLESWVEADKLAAAIDQGDTQAILNWIEKIGTGEPTEGDRRLMCEFLAEIGRNPIIAELHHKFDRRLRGSLYSALRALHPTACPARQGVLVDFILSISWGMMVRMELATDTNDKPLRAYVASLLSKELSILANEPAR